MLGEPFSHVVQCALLPYRRPRHEGKTDTYAGVMPGRFAGFVRKCRGGIEDSASVGMEDVRVSAYGCSPDDLNPFADDGIVVGGTVMPTYVIDAKQGLWRIDREAPEDWNNVAVERPACPQCWHRETARLPFEEVVVDPTDQELAELRPDELARFGLTREVLLGLGH